jgi:hypothetical protein
MGVLLSSVFSLALVISVDQGWAEFIMDRSDRANRLLENSPLFTKRLGTLDLVRVGKKRESSFPSVEY